MTILIEINDIDKTSYVSWNSLSIENILTKQVDTCRFTIENYEGKVYKPSIEDDIKIYCDGTLIFGGNIKRITEKVRTDKILVFDIECADYTRLMDKKRVAIVYSGTPQTVNAIITDLRDKYFPDFTVANVACATTIDYIVFNYEIPSQCFNRLADLTGYDWYVDCNKDIHFFLKGSNPAPFNLDDTGAKYVFNSLNLNKDTSQIRNGIFVRGGEFLGDLYTENLVSSGTPLTYPLAYKYSTLTATISGTPYTVGIDNIDNADDYDCLHNFEEKIIRFKETTKPADKAPMVITGYPYVPVMVYRGDPTSKIAYGEFQHYQYEKGLQDRDSAEKFGDIMLEAYKNPIVKGTFKTYETGTPYTIRSGQDITIQSTIRGIDENVLIDRVTAKMITPFDLIYEVSFVSTKNSGIIEILAGLLLKKQTAEFRTDEIVYKSWIFATEAIALVDSIPVFKDKETGPWYVSGGVGTPVMVAGFFQAS